MKPSNAFLRSWRGVIATCLSLVCAALATSAPTIQTSPTPASIATGAAANFQVSATSGLPLTFQWQVSADGGATWQNLSDTAPYSGVTTHTLTVTAATRAHCMFQFRCVVSDSSGSTNSDAAFLRVAPDQAPFYGSEQFTDGTYWSAPLRRQASLSFASGRLEFTAPAGSGEYFAMREWTRTAGTYTANWSVQVDVHLDALTLGDDQYANLNLAVFNADESVRANMERDAMVVSIDRYGNGTVTVRGFEGNGLCFDGTTTHDTGLTHLDSPSLNATLRISFDATTKTLSSWFDPDGAADGYQWTLVRALEIATGTYNWQMDTNSRFGVALIGAGNQVAFTSGQASFDNFAGGPSTAPAIFSQPQRALGDAGTPAQFRVAASSAFALSFQWQYSTDQGSTWQNATDGLLYSGAQTAALQLQTTTSAMEGYQYRCLVSDGQNPAIASASATLTAHGCQFAALSARAQVGTGEGILIMGFAFAGEGKPMLIRGVGPGLGTAEPRLRPLALANPQLQLHARVQNQWVAGTSNDDWGGSAQMRQECARVGAGALEDTSKDAAILETLSSQIYTAHVSGVDGTTGIALAEAYDADLADRTKRMIALSMRIHVGTDDNIIITGFVLSGDAGKRVIIRGIGPAMADSVSGYLRDPELLLYRYNTQNSTWALVGQNDNWGGSADMAAAFAAVGLGALDSDSRDSALILDLDPGIYTAHVRSANGETGIGLAEIYEAR